MRGCTPPDGQILLACPLSRINTCTEQSGDCASAATNRRPIKPVAPVINTDLFGGSDDKRGIPVWKKAGQQSQFGVSALASETRVAHRMNRYID
jgi:hypothetical protein